MSLRARFFNTSELLFRAERLNGSILHKDVVKVLTRDSTSVTGIGHSATMHDTCLMPVAQQRGFFWLRRVIWGASYEFWILEILDFLYLKSYQMITMPVVLPS